MCVALKFTWTTDTYIDIEIEILWEKYRYRDCDSDNDRNTWDFIKYYAYKNIDTKSGYKLMWLDGNGIDIDGPNNYHQHLHTSFCNYFYHSCFCSC